MAYWHYPDGTPAPPFKGKFDPSHLWPIIPVGVALVVAFLQWLMPHLEWK